MGTLITISATFIGFIIIATIYYSDKFMKFYGSTRFMEKDKYEIDKRKTISSWFIISLLLILGPLFFIGFWTIFSAFDTMAMMTTSTTPLTLDIEKSIDHVRFLFTFLFFDVITGAMAFLIVGYFYGTVLSEKYEALGEMKDIELKFREIRKRYIPEYLEWKSEKLGRDLTDEEKEGFIERIEIANLFRNGQVDEILIEFSDFMRDKMFKRDPSESDRPKDD